jgi:hypothetical protein
MDLSRDRLIHDECIWSTSPFVSVLIVVMLLVLFLGLFGGVLVDRCRGSAEILYPFM